MKKHARLMFGITKKTRFAVAMVVVAVILVFAVITLGYVGVFGLDPSCRRLLLLLTKQVIHSADLD